MRKFRLVAGPKLPPAPKPPKVPGTLSTPQSISQSVRAAATRVTGMPGYKAPPTTAQAMAAKVPGAGQRAWVSEQPLKVTLGPEQARTTPAQRAGFYDWSTVPVQQMHQNFLASVGQENAARTAYRGKVGEEAAAASGIRPALEVNPEHLWSALSAQPAAEREPRLLGTFRNPLVRDNDAHNLYEAKVWDRKRGDWAHMRDVLDRPESDFGLTQREASRFIGGFRMGKRLIKQVVVAPVKGEELRREDLEPTPEQRRALRRRKRRIRSLIRPEEGR